jgi:site-specific recombinase XerD
MHTVVSQDSGVTRTKRQSTAPDIPTELERWERALSAERKSPQTIKIYGDGMRAFLRWCAATGTAPALDRATVTTFTAALLGDGAAAATARSRQLAVRRFTAWLADEDVLPADPLRGMKPPKLDTPNVPKLSDVKLAALLKACEGKTFMDRRDEALIRLALETAARAEELLAMTMADVDLDRGVITIRRGKGGQGRVAPFGPVTGRAIDRYLRMRATHRLAATAALWLGDRGKEWHYHGFRNALGRRAETAGIKDFHPHRLRHSAASRWLAAGGSEGGLMAIAGWRSRDMLDRYVADTAMDRAADESRRLGLGDL